MSIIEFGSQHDHLSGALGAEQDHLVVVHLLGVELAVKVTGNHVEHGYLLGSLVGAEVSLHLAGIPDQAALDLLRQGDDVDASSVGV